jgi:hypothetical protein
MFESNQSYSNTPQELKDVGIFLTGEKNVKDFNWGILMFYSLNGVMQLSREKSAPDGVPIEYELVRSCLFLSTLIKKYQGVNYTEKLTTLKDKRKNELAKAYRTEMPDEASKIRMFREVDLDYSIELFDLIMEQINEAKLLPTLKGILIDGWVEKKEIKV